jgi:hypothetical protein
VKFNFVDADLDQAVVEVHQVAAMVPTTVAVTVVKPRSSFLDLSDTMQFWCIIWLFLVDFRFSI